MARKKEPTEQEILLAELNKREKEKGKSPCTKTGLSLSELFYAIGNARNANEYDLIIADIESRLSWLFEDERDYYKIVSKISNAPMKPYKFDHKIAFLMELQNLLRKYDAEIQGDGLEMWVGNTNITYKHNRLTLDNIFDYEK